MRRSVYNHIRSLQAIPPAGNRTNGTVNGVTIDRFGSDVYATSVGFVVHTGVITDGTHAVSVEDSDNGSAWAAASAADVQGSAPSIVAADDNRLFEIGYVGPKRYVRCSIATSSATTGGFVDAVAMLGVQPVKRP